MFVNSSRPYPYPLRTPAKIPVTAYTRNTFSAPIASNPSIHFGGLPRSIIATLRRLLPRATRETAPSTGTKTTLTARRAAEVAPSPTTSPPITLETGRGSTNPAAVHLPVTTTEHLLTSLEDYQRLLTAESQYILNGAPGHFTTQVPEEEFQTFIEQLIPIRHRLPRNDAVRRERFSSIRQALLRINRVSRILGTTEKRSEDSFLNDYLELPSSLLTHQAESLQRTQTRLQEAYQQAKTQLDKTTDATERQRIITELDQLVIAQHEELRTALLRAIHDTDREAQNIEFNLQYQQTLQPRSSATTPPAHLATRVPQSDSAIIEALGRHAQGLLQQQFPTETQVTQPLVALSGRACEKQPSGQWKTTLHPNDQLFGSGIGAALETINRVPKRLLPDHPLLAGISRDASYDLRAHHNKEGDRATIDSIVGEVQRSVYNATAERLRQIRTDAIEALRAEHTRIVEQHRTQIAEALARDTDTTRPGHHSTELRAICTGINQEFARLVDTHLAEFNTAVEQEIAAFEGNLATALQRGPARTAQDLLDKLEAEAASLRTHPPEPPDSPPPTGGRQEIPAISPQERPAPVSDQLIRPTDSPTDKAARPATDGATSGGNVVYDPTKDPGALAPDTITPAPDDLMAIHEAATAPPGAPYNWRTDPDALKPEAKGLSRDVSPAA